jgi:RNA polymerase sigma-70 factor (ECF subfamily)
MSEQLFTLEFTNLNCENNDLPLGIKGNVPSWINGTLFRNGPAKFTSELGWHTELLYIKYKNSLRIYAFGFIRDWGIVEDIIQEVYIKVFLKLNTLKDDSSIKSWLYTITANQCKDYLRTKYLKVTLLKDHLEDLVHPNSDLVENEVIKSSDMSILKNIILTLPNHYYEPLILYYFDNLSYQKISSLLGISLSTVKVRIHRAKKMLREKIKAQENIELIELN